MFGISFFRVSSAECRVPILMLALLFAGCSTTSTRPIGQAKPVETVDQQLDAAQKVVGAMGNKDVSREELKALGRDMHNNVESRSAVQKIMGASADKPVVKYSPATGKHYSGDLEYDPETGVKLETVPE